MKEWVFLLVAALAAASCSNTTSVSAPTQTATNSVPISKSVIFDAISEGNKMSSFAEFRKNGTAFYHKTGGAGGGRGFNIAVIDLNTGEQVGQVQNFDTWGSVSPSLVTAYLDSIPNKSLILIAVGDEAGINHWDTCDFYSGSSLNLIDSLRALGSTMISNYCYGYSWSMIAIKGGDKKDEQLLTIGDAKSTFSLQLP
ncbi:MAG: interleukin-like EMT inducer domain-containing protein [Candidatus Doudnabacteria bacterium]